MESFFRTNSKKVKNFLGKNKRLRNIFVTDSSAIFINNLTCTGHTLIFCHFGKGEQLW